MSGSEPRALELALVLVLPLGLSCSSGTRTFEAPDVSQLLAAYASPLGTVDAAHPGAWLDTSTAQVDLLGGGQADLLLVQVATDAFRGVDQASLPTGHDDVVPTRIDGVATLQVACGAASHEIADVALAIVDGVISRELWGTAHGCPLWQGVGYRESYDGEFTMYRYPGTDLLVRIDGKLASAGSEVHLDFRLTGGRLETRVQTTAGDVIAYREGVDVIARAGNGTFRCNPKQRLCVRE